MTHPAAGTPRYGRWALSLVAAAGVSMCITLMFWSMRAVMEVGGACASGNSPYQIQTQCPDGVAWIMPLAIVLGIVLAFAYAFLAPPGLAGLAVLAWCGLFLALGWNFFEYGLNPPGETDGPVWGWIVPGVLFVLMGAAPLLAMIALVRSAMRDPSLGVPFPGAAPARRRLEARAARRAASGEPSARRATPRGPAPTRTAAPTATAESPDDLVEALERLAALHARGALDADEYEAAKRRLLGDAGEGA